MDDGVNSTITITPPTAGSSTGYVLGGETLEIQIGENADGGVNQISNPDTVAEYEIGIKITNDEGTESGEVTVPIVDDDTVNIVENCDGISNTLGSGINDGNYYCGMTTLEPTEIFNTNLAPVEEARIEFAVGVAPSSTNSTGTYEDYLTLIATGTF